MATEAQIIANRRNALKSTGPRTTNGRAAVSKNAVKHGLLARKDVINSESQADFDLYRNKILLELDPVTPMEAMLAERIVTLSWRLKRAARIQNLTIDAFNTPKTPGPLDKITNALVLNGRLLPEQDESNPHLQLGRLAIKDFSNAGVLERLLMYERRIENSLYKTILELQRLSIIKKMNTEPTTNYEQ